MNIPRNRYVIAYKDINNKMYCIMCWRSLDPTSIDGWHCPIHNLNIHHDCNHYAGGGIKNYLFDNTQHKIISTLDKCGLKELGCTNFCDTCISWHITQGDYE